MWKKSLLIIVSFLFLSLIAINTIASPVTITENFTEFYFDPHGMHWNIIQFYPNPEKGPDVGPPIENDGEPSSKVYFKLNLENRVPNYIVFEGSKNVEVNKGETFVLGYLSFFNGDWWVQDTLTAAYLTLTSHSSDNNFNNIILNLEFRVITTPDNPNPFFDADFIYFPSNGSIGSFRVYEDQLGIVELLGRFGSLELVGFGQVLTPGVAYTNPSIDVLPAVPEPATVLLLGSGLIGLAGYGRKKFLKK